MLTPCPRSTFIHLETAAPATLRDFEPESLLRAGGWGQAPWKTQKPSPALCIGGQVLGDFILEFHVLESLA